MTKRLALYGTSRFVFSPCSWRDRFLFQLQASLKHVRNERLHVGEGWAAHQARQIPLVSRGERTRPGRMCFQRFDIHAMRRGPRAPGDLLAQLGEDAQPAVI
jgi:hypothetical protein